MPRLTRWTVYGLQALSLAIGYGLVTTPFLVFVLLVLGVIKGTVSVTTLIIFTVAMSLLVLPLSISIAIVLKWLIVRRYKPGAYPLWGFYYFRWWLATRVQSVSGMALFEGTPLMSLFYRLMGAKIGKHCIIDTSLCAIYDLLTIGDDTCIGARTQLLGYRVENGMLIIGEIEIGSRCFHRHAFRDWGEHANRRRRLLGRSIVSAGWGVDSGRRVAPWLARRAGRSEAAASR